mgnify:FL=1
MTKNVKITFMYSRDEYGEYLNARLDTPRGVRWLSDVTTEETIVDALRDADVDLEIDYDWSDYEEEDYR